MTARPQPAPDTPADRELEAARDRRATEQLLERIAAEDLAEHRARARVLPSSVGHIGHAAW